MAKYHKYGRFWYTTREEAEEELKDGEEIRHDSGTNAFYITQKRKPFWRF